MRRIVLAAFTLTVAACSSKPEVPPPIVDGSYLTYRVRETTDSQATLRFSTTDSGYQVAVEANGGKAQYALGGEAEPKDGKLELPIQSGKLDLVQVWLPPHSRKPGARTPAGRVNKRQPYQQWQVWEVLRGNPNPETRYYEVNTGMLVGWKIGRGSTDVGGLLVDSQ